MEHTLGEPLLDNHQSNDGGMIALFHHQVTNGQRNHFRTTNAGAEKKHEEGIVSFATTPIVLY